MAALPTNLSPEGVRDTARDAGRAGLPPFLTKRPDGWFVAVTQLGKDGAFLRFVDSVFAGGNYFVGLELAHLNRLLYGGEQAAAASTALVRLAADILAFAPERRALYRSVQLSPDGTSADYLFESVYLESIDDPPVPVNGSAAASAAVAPKSRLAATTPTKLDFDEFVAHLWINGVRVGIDEVLVRQIIAKGGTGRLTVAKWIEPIAGKNAGIEEKSKLLRRDHSPKLLRNGGVDLGMFQNHFPQVEKGELLIRKTPCVAGVNGRKITGDIVAPAVPADFDLNTLAGTGTRVEIRPDGQYIVAQMTGFVSIDKTSNQLSITAKIVNRAGVSMRTTGDLQLTGEDYEEFGEVQERRTVEGKHITIHADVFGNVVSRGGNILLERNLMKGRASSHGGEITVRGLASAAILDAPGGTIRVKRAEGCALAGDHIIVESATQCQIVGRQVEVGTAAGCTIVAQSVTIAVSKDHRRGENAITMIVPNEAANEKKQAEARKRMAEISAKLETTRQDREALKEQQGFGNFLLLKEKLAKGEIQITAAQRDNLFKVENRMVALMQQFRVMGAAIEELQRTYAEAEATLRALEQETASVGSDVQCAIASVAGETVVRTLRMDTNIDSFASEGVQALMTKVRALNTTQDKLFSGSSAKFSWRYKKSNADKSTK